jgi:hypothetical protein
MAAAMMAVAVAEVASMSVVALTLGGNGGGRIIREAETSEGGMVFYLQASGGSIRHGAIDEPMEEGAGEGEGGDPHWRCGADGGTPIPLVDIVKPNVNDKDNNNNNNNNNNEGAVLRGGGRTTNKWDFEEVARRRKAT